MPNECKDRLLSDSELRFEIVNILDEYDEKKLYVPTRNRIETLINTQKRLYAESVIGEDEAEPYYIRSQIEVNAKNGLRAEQRARIE